MSALKYFTRGGESPQGLRSVYFCARNDDFRRYFTEISNDIVQIQRCSIWYHHSPVAHDETFWADIEEMNLVVIPVTSELLYTDSDDVMEVFRFAQKQNIPVLPLLQEAELETAFNQKFGKLQCLNKYAQDTTAVPYEQKLQKYLETVLVGDELARKIRDAFDSYVFLSYRKKDRKHAQELMRRIHRNDLCRDVAIWYDEFLIPGEDFEKNIRQALEKSSLYIFTVTPNIVEKVRWQDGTIGNNYVVQVEFPEAYKRNKDMILPVQMLPTDRTRLDETFDGLLPACTDGKDPLALSQALSAKLQNAPLRKRESDPEHDYLIGLAYLSGLDMETDAAKALTLIKDSAATGYIDATEKLVDMYYNGIGVARNMETAIFWQKKLIAQWEARFRADQSDQSFRKWFWSSINCSDYYVEKGQPQQAKEMLVQMEDICRRMPQETAYYLDVLYERMGDTLIADKHEPEALIYYKKCLDNRLAMGEETPWSMRNLTIIYERMGKVCTRLNRLDDAIDYYTKKQQLNQKLCRTEDTMEDWIGLLYANYQLANTYLKRLYSRDSDRAEDLKQAVLHCLQSIEIGQRLTAGNIDQRVRQCYMAAYSLMGELCVEVDDLSRVIERDLPGELPELEEPKFYAMQGLALANKYYENSWHSLDATLHLLSVHRRLGKIYEKSTKSMAMDMYQNRSELSAQMRKDVEEDISLLELAKTQYGKAHNLALTAYRTYGAISAAGDLYQCYMDLCSVCLNLKYHHEKEKLRKQMHEKSLDYCKEALKVAKKLEAETSSAGNCENVARGYLMMAKLEPKNDKMYVQQAVDIYEKLVKRYPDVASYRNNLEGCKMYLRGEGILVV